MMAKYIVRNLCKDDYDSNYLQLLGHDFTINESAISFADFTHYVSSLDTNHQIIVIEHNSNDIIGSSTIFIETKLIHRPQSF